MSRQTTVTSLLDRGQTKDVNEMKLHETAGVKILQTRTRDGPNLSSVKHLYCGLETYWQCHREPHSACKSCWQGGRLWTCTIVGALFKSAAVYSAIETAIRRQLSLCCYAENHRHRNNCTFLNVMFHMRPSSPWRHVVLRLRLEYWPRHDYDLPLLNIQNITYLSWLLYQII